MKNNKPFQALSIAFIALALMFVCGQAHAQSSIENISLLVKTEKDSYALGEVVDLRFRINNLTTKSLEIAKPDVGSGNLKLLISEDGKTFQEYVGPGWGIACNPFSPKVKLERDGSYELKATILYNHRVPTEHLTELYAERIRKQRIDSEFALPNAGSYWLKAVFTDGKTVTESEPLAIDVSEPIGLDAVVWLKMKSDGAYAYFLHTGEVKYQADSIEAGKFVDDLRQILSDDPSSMFADRINSGLTKSNENLEHVRRLRAEPQPSN